MPSSPRIINGRFVLLPRPKAGGMADVFRAVDNWSEQKTVAVKVLRTGSIENEILQEVFRRETAALSSLRHPNIVELIDHGFDEVTGEYFLALEWVDSTLQDLVRDHPPDGWDSFAEEIAIPVLRALDLAHTRGCAHRDIKPTNVLITSEGAPKLADFGISKLRQAVDASVTVRDFVSRPYAPPEDDDGKHQFARDVYSFAAVCVFALADRPLKSADDLATAAAVVDTPEEIRDILKLCLSKAPSERPASGGVLLSLIETIHRKRSTAWAHTQVCHLRCVDQARRDLEQMFETSDETQLYRRVLSDLAGSCHFGLARDRGPDLPSNQRARYRLIGNCLDLAVDIEPLTGDAFAIRRVWRRSPSEMDRGRELSWPCPFSFKFARPSDSRQAKLLIESLEGQLRRFEDECVAAADQQRRAQLFDRWRSILKALDKIQRDQQPMFRYSGWQRDPLEGVVFAPASEPPSAEMIGTRWKVDANTPIPVFGELLSTDQAGVVLSLSSEMNPPKAGILRMDTAAADEAVRRQRDTVNEVHEGGSSLPRPDVSDLLVSPSKARPPVPTDVSFCLELDDAKREAVRAALGTRDFLLVQGPPGTGKTTFIAEVVLQYLKKNEGSSILLSSQTHVALDNAIDRIRRAKNDIKILRIGNPASERILPSVRPLLLDNQLPGWTDEVSAAGQEFLGEWAEQRGLPKADVQQALLLRVIAHETRSVEQLVGTRQSIESQLGSTRSRRDAHPAEEGDFSAARDDLESRLEEVTSRIKEAERRRRLTESKLKEYSKVWDGVGRLPVDQIEAAAAPLIPVAANTKQLIDLLSLHPRWCDRLGNRRGLESAVLAHYDIVAATCIGLAGVPGFRDVDFDLCIVDEASKATATEVLVPLARSRSWIVVGDDRQLPPYQSDLQSNRDLLEEHRLTAEEVDETVFDRLNENLPDECKRTLSVQHRMVAPIGNLISTCFYGGDLKSARTDLDPVVAKAFGHPVNWWTTSRVPQRFEQKELLSRTNPLEAMIIGELLEKLNQAVGPDYEKIHSRRYSVAVLTAYVAQKNRLERGYAAKQVTLPFLDVVINTVDAFQGQEADVAMFSAVRSNPGQDFGFLRDFERLNVALSRGRNGLAIIADADFFRKRQTGNPLFEVLRYLDTAPAGCRVGEFQR